VSLRSEPIELSQLDKLSATGRSAVRKASLRLIPLIALGYGTAYMDRVNISFAALQMNRDLHFSNAAYGFGAGLFFLSFALCEVPSNLLLYHFGARRWLSRIMFTWGVIAMGMVFVKTPIQFYAVRALLGAAEAGFFPGVIFYLMQWFPPEMRAHHHSLLHFSSAQLCHHGSPCGSSSEPAGTSWSRRIAMALPFRGPPSNRLER
jgi:ACS family tartrate transporter-like MFS transporter